MTTGDHEAPVEVQIEAAVEKLKNRKDYLCNLGGWSSTYDYKRGVIDRVPKPGQTDAPGFDAGIAVGMGLIPEGKDKLAAMLHANYTKEAVAQVLKETQDLENIDPESETAYWLAACRLCNEGHVDQSSFLKQVEDFKALLADPEKRRQTAKQEFEHMASSFSLQKIGDVDNVPVGTADGCIQGAYIKGHPLGVLHDVPSGQYFVGTFLKDLPLDGFEWKDAKDDAGEPMNGVLNPRFVMCADKEEMEKVITWINTKEPKFFEKVDKI